MDVPASESSREPLRNHEVSCPDLLFIGLVLENEFKSCKASLARELRPVRPPNEGWLTGFGENMMKSQKSRLLSLRDRWPRDRTASRSPTCPKPSTKGWWQG